MSELEMELENVSVPMTDGKISGVDTKSCFRGFYSSLSDMII